MTEMSDLHRAEFEAWISAPPFEKSVERYGFGYSEAWPGQYVDSSVELAWEAWQAARGLDKAPNTPHWPTVAATLRELINCCDGDGVVADRLLDIRAREIEEGKE